MLSRVSYAFSSGSVFGFQGATFSLSMGFKKTLIICTMLNKT